MESVLVVKHTFIELESAHVITRLRADTDTLVDYCFSDTSLGEYQIHASNESWADTSEVDSEKLPSTSPTLAADRAAQAEQWQSNNVTLSPACYNFVGNTVSSVGNILEKMTPMASWPVFTASWYLAQPADETGKQERGGPRKAERLRKKSKSGNLTEPDLKHTFNFEGTTVVLRQLPKSLEREQLLELLDQRFAGLYDFFYLPLDFKMSQNLGYAIINFVNAEATEAALAAFNGTRFERSVIMAERSKNHTELDSLVQRYRKSPLVTGDVPDRYRPLLFLKGQRVAFP